MIQRITGLRAISKWVWEELGLFKDRTNERSEWVSVEKENKKNERMKWAMVFDNLGGFIFRFSREVCSISQLNSTISLKNARPVSLFWTTFHFKIAGPKVPHGADLGQIYVLFERNS